MDINADLGESKDRLINGQDEMLMRYIHSVNIACGEHAGNLDITIQTVHNAKKYGLKIGAHPGFPDRANFGRRELELSPTDLRKLIERQLLYLQDVAGSIHHIKPHGALYNMSAKRQDYARAIAEAVRDFDPRIVIYGLSGSLSITEAQKLGLVTCAEVFADRAYLSDGTLAPRALPGAVLTENMHVRQQVIQLLKGWPISTIDGNSIQLCAETICIHSDTPGAERIAQWVADALKYTE